MAGAPGASTWNEITPVSDVMIHCCCKLFGIQGFAVPATKYPFRGSLALGNKSALEYPAQMVLQH
jgi:hypothetical protein